ncbi:hypothetical protein Tco_0429719 [Tanacetum coccineum]
MVIFRRVAPAGEQSVIRSKSAKQMAAKTDSGKFASRNFGVNIAGGTKSSSQVSSTPGTDEVVCSFFAQHTTRPPLDNEDLQHIDQRLGRIGY